MAGQPVYRASTTAPVNIAVIKYWGKRDTQLNLPTNSSLSVTLSQRDLRTHTTASCSASYAGPDSLLLNGEPQSLDTPRSQACLRQLRALRARLEAADSSLPMLSKFPLKIVSMNNFPTAAGLASSAAGFAALVRSIADLFQIAEAPAELSLIARQGSGSACRSLLGGYVAWDAGTASDGSDSKARLVAPQEHWPEMRALILVVSAEKKGVSSTAGMQATVATSSLFESRATKTVPMRMAQMEKAIHDKDFDSFAKLTMQDSNSFHATCLDTYPPIFYMNDVSRAAIQLVERLNQQAGRTIAAYTFDAGPNAVIYFLQSDAVQILSKVSAVLGGSQDGRAGVAKGLTEGKLSKEDEEAFGLVQPTLRKGISRIIFTAVGDGPNSIDLHLVDAAGNVQKSDQQSLTKLLSD